MTPYYQDEQATIYFGDNSKMIGQLERCDMLLTDPPYGIGADAKNFRSRTATRLAHLYNRTSWDTSAPKRWVLDAAIDKARYSIIWGGNYYGLPAARCWLVWDKETPLENYGRVELAWTNLDRVHKMKKKRWYGAHAREQGEERWHCTQKPVDLMLWCMSQAPDVKTILDPWMGSGTTLVAALKSNRRVVGIDSSEKNCEIAVKRLRLCAANDQAEP